LGRSPDRWKVFTYDRAAGEAAKLPFPIHVHMLRHSTGYALAARGMDTRRLQHVLGHASGHQQSLGLDVGLLFGFR
jgi:site-specific recombinase XerD